MKTLFKPIILIFIPFLFVSLRCERDIEPKPTIPPPTQEGKNVLGCKINGRVWAATGGFYGVYKKFEFSITNGKSFNLRANGHYEGDKTSDTIRSLEFIFKNLSSSKNILLNSKLINFKILSGASFGFFNTDTNNYGNFNVTKFDTVNKILSGTFEFKAMNPNTNEVINVTDGVLDVNFNEKTIQ